jgi:hypothetical protein
MRKFKMWPEVTGASIGFIIGVPFISLVDCLLGFTLALIAQALIRIWVGLPIYVR